MTGVPTVWEQRSARSGEQVAERTKVSAAASFVYLSHSRALRLGRAILAF